jgi:pimeloyl-ACP methyl ester carboxylesterase
LPLKLTQPKWIKVCETGKEAIKMISEIRKIQSGDVSLSVQVAGAGPLVILMHGWPELGYSYRHQIGPLAAAGYTVAAPDMRGYGGSSKPADPSAYSIDHSVDDMAAIAKALGHENWIAVGHDWGSPVAWRCALRFPEQVRGVFSLSVPHYLGKKAPSLAAIDAGFPDSFFYMRYFQEIGIAEAELERDPRDALKRVYYAVSGDAPQFEWLKPRPRNSPLLDGLSEPPPGPLSFMTDEELDVYAQTFAQNGFFGPLCWYRTLAANAAQASALPNEIIQQPAGFLCGDKEIVLAMFENALAENRKICADLRVETVLPGAGHWIQQERPAEVSAALIAFLNDVYGSQKGLRP